MSLRRRLFAAMGVVLALILIGGFIVVRSQRSFLIEQVDEQLAGAISSTIPYPLLDTPVQLTPGSSAIPIPPDDPILSYDDHAFFPQVPSDAPIMTDDSHAFFPPIPPDEPISTLFVGMVEGGRLIPFLEGRLIDDIPDVPMAMPELDGLESQALTVDGVEGRVRFRIRTVGDPEMGGFWVVALPIDEVESAIHRLQLVLLIVGGLVLGVMAAAIWWVERLGVKPIRNVTRVAEAISAGDRSQRVEQTDSRTEAGKLAHAFNVMLDDRDTIEARRRQFVADASHELRTPLTSIQGYLDLYSHGRFVDPELVEDMMRRMGREATRMKALVEDLLLLANLDQQRPLRRSRVDLNRLITDAANDARAVQPRRSILVETPDPAVETTGDEFRLQQVVAALVDNALTHTDITCRIRLEVRATPTGTEIIVADDGPGLDSTHADRVFDRFFRYDQSRSRATGGSGLGLAIARSIVEAHHGTIQLHTAPGAGCTFTIFLPANRPDDPDTAGSGAEGES